MPNRPRAYRRPVSVEETAQRIARSLREHRAAGVARAATAYTTRPEVLHRVAQILTLMQGD